MNEFIINAIPKEVEIDEDKITEIETKISESLELTEEEINYFLSYLMYITRIKLDSDYKNATYTNACNKAQCMLHHYLESLGITNFICVTDKAITPGVIRHFFTTVYLNNKLYLLDPTYRQFFEKERCSKNKDVPGNFITDISSCTALLENGYIELTEDTAKMYGDSFMKTKESARNLEINGPIYLKAFIKNTAPLIRTKEELEQEDLLLTSRIKTEQKSK